MVNDALRRHRVADNHRLASAHDAGFFKTDGFAVVAQQLHVVEVNARDDGAVSVKNIDRVEPAAQPDLENDNIEFGIGQQLHDRQRGEFKVAQRDFNTVFDSCALDTAKACYQIRSADNLAANPAALFKINQMR